MVNIQGSRTRLNVPEIRAKVGFCMGKSRWVSTNLCRHLNRTNPVNVIVGKVSHGEFQTASKSDNFYFPMYEDWVSPTNFGFRSRKGSPKIAKNRCATFRIILIRSRSDFFWPEKCEYLAMCWRYEAET
jgi:hypothetical protein